ncbi:alpha-ribazole phosphatase [Caldisalinibacter kiritimatiensis]|uniref:Alpha-ribazole phosphatase n=1 Tax=Caldisalinibacter kiritimatiensis TaxID=1304284 RepID=R1CUQ0_9FIRM|nr:alpha-ribazole phosphatase [Caldisalinibacter kiritimatiensis]EOD00389.1 Phosphoglycerate mutase [Caldisalinibacter kiritimatiensis]
MKFIIVRHGETKANVNGIYSGWTDFPLTERGFKQIKRIKKYLKDKRIDKVYSSPLKRALITSKEITKGNKLKVNETEKLKEINFGIFDGKMLDEIVKVHSTEWKEWTNNYINYRIPSGESLQDLHNRVVNFINEIITKEKETVLLITHGGVMRVIIAYLLGLDIKDTWHFKTSPGCLVEIEYEDGYSVLTQLINF